MIRVSDLSKKLQTGSQSETLFDSISLDIPTDRRLALLGRPGSGKTTFLHLLAGIQLPSAGRIERIVRVSYPVGYSRFFKLRLSPRDNVKFFARCYGSDPNATADFVSHVAEMNDWFDVPLHKLPNESRLRLGFSLSYALPFDVYLIDNSPAAGTPSFREKCREMLRLRLEEAGIIFATTEPRVARRYCDCALVIRDRKLSFHEDIEEAVDQLSANTP